MSPPVANKNSFDSAATKVAPATKAAPSVLQFTAISEIPAGVAKLVDSFHNSKKTHSVQYRLNQLRNVYFALKDNGDEIAEALEKDFSRSASETRNLELGTSLTEVVHTMSSLHKWVQPDKVPDLPQTMTCPVYVEKIPLGVVLIISPFNYPLLLSVGAIIGALAAGNCVVFKPSELTPNFSKLFTEIMSAALDDDIFYVVNGGIQETTALLEQKFDKIMYTGNNMVGTIIAKKAAETLTPVLLELGGKSPAFVLEDVKDKDLATVARRIAWGRFTNAGQTCVAVDYVLVHETKKAALVKHLVAAVEETLFKDVDENDTNYTHIIHDRAFENLVKILKQSKGRVVTGGTHNAAAKYIAPTILDNVNWDDSTMRGEIFGPLLPIITYSNLDEALANIRQRCDTPLAQYVFTSGNTNRNKNKELDTILTRIRSGATVINDVMMHVPLTSAPFGGIGNSGQGAYHGIYSFRAFSHERTTIEAAFWNEFAMKARYPPYNEDKDKLFVASQRRHNGKVWFGRTGDVPKNGPSSLFTIWTGIAGFSAVLFYVGAIL